MFACDLFGTEKAAFKKSDRGFSESAKGTFLCKKSKEELIDEGVDGVAGFGLELNEAMTVAGEFAHGMGIGEEFFIRA